MRPLLAVLLLAIANCACAQTVASKPIEIKVVVINMFEAGADTGDIPGEYQYWVEREHLDTVLPFPQGYHDLRINPDTGVLGLLTGVGTARAAASVMALGLDPRFDLTHAYFLVAGIGGIDPAAGSLASAVWSEWIVDGDLGYEIDAREIPHDTPKQRALWTTGYIPLRKTVPYEQPPQPMGADSNATYHLNRALVDWAFRLTKDVAIPDTPGMKDLRMQFEGDAATARPSSSKARTSPPARSGTAS
jgi:purine nucleoside permease